MISRSVRQQSKTSDKGEALDRFILDFGVDKSKVDLSGTRWIKRFFCKIPDGMEEKDVEDSFFSGESYAIFDKKIIPTLKLLDLVRGAGATCLKLNDKASWLFICGRDILSQGIAGGQEKDGLKSKKIIVCNLRNEIIGVAQRSGKELDNYWNIGDYLKREMHKEN